MVRLLFSMTIRSASFADSEAAPVTWPATRRRKPTARKQAAIFATRIVMCGTLPVFRKCQERAELRASNQPAGKKHQHSADNDLKRGLQERRVHVAMADVTDSA